MEKAGDHSSMGCAKSQEQKEVIKELTGGPLLSWLPRFEAQVMNKMRNGKDGKTSEMRRTGRRWRKPVAQFGEKVWFRKIWSSFVGHHDRTGAVLCITKNGRMELCEAKVERDRH